VSSDEELIASFILRFLLAFFDNFFDDVGAELHREKKAGSK